MRDRKATRDFEPLSYSLAMGTLALKRGYDWMRAAIRRPDPELIRIREEVERQMHEALPPSGPPLARSVLVDGSFDNPNYFLRLALMQAALGLAGARQIGLTGEYSVDPCTATLRRLGIENVVPFISSSRSEARRLARSFLRHCRTADDVLALQLPYGFPTATLYDHALRIQRKASLDVTDPLLVEYVADVLQALQSAERLLDSHDPDLILLSHAVTPLGAALAWLGMRRGIHAIVMFGMFGTCRYWRMTEPEHFFACMDAPRGHDLESLDANQLEALREIGSRYLDYRLSGLTNDVATRFAFAQGQRPSRAILSEHFGWDPSKPVVTVYASNWFDYPHFMGMSHFTDFLDWIEVTRRVAEQRTAVNWLFRAHPVDAWYGGLTLSDVLSDGMPPHMKLCPVEWTGGAVMDMADAMVTCHGTAGVEYAARGKPVLSADPGPAWYRDCGFTLVPRDRADYEALLGRNWWTEIALAHARGRAEAFAGWYFCVPEWQNGATLPDDALQQKLHPYISRYLGNCSETVATEVRTIRMWFESGDRLYHTWKMRQAQSYALSNTL